MRFGEHLPELHSSFSLSKRQKLKWLVHVQNDVSEIRDQRGGSPVNWKACDHGPGISLLYH